ncbi:hypothetical protein [uncultured Salinisphaera sp.]|uniref:hypothetical protein n=1 Tax=uncultured Salinisphaera sp. TaxID=359372 RepID=UPI0032B2B53C
MDKLETRNRRAPLLRSGLALALVLAPFAAAQAYVGPGAGLSLLGALWGVVAAIGAALLFVLLWPIRRMRRRKKEQAAARDAHAATPGNDPGNGPTRN